MHCQSNDHLLVVERSPNKPTPNSFDPPRRTIFLASFCCLCALLELWLTILQLFIVFIRWNNNFQQRIIANTVGYTLSKFLLAWAERFSLTVFVSIPQQPFQQEWSFRRNSLFSRSLLSLSWLPLMPKKQTMTMAPTIMVMMLIKNTMLTMESKAGMALELETTI